MSETLKHKAVKGVAWKIIEFGGKQLVQLGISVVLARLIMPEQFGAIAMLAVFIAVANAFVDSGFAETLIRKNDRDQLDCCTVFYFNICISLAAYAILYLIAPLVADFYSMSELCPVLRVSSLSIIISSTSAIHNTLLISNLKFNILAKYNILSLIISGSVGIALAFMDFQVWALVFQSLTSTLITTIFLWIKSPWRPSLLFSFKRLREFIGFGSKLLASGLLDTIYNNLYYIFIGKVYKAAELAYYNRGNSISMMFTGTPTNVLQSVTFPTLCKLQDDNSKLESGYRRTLKISAFVIFPIALGVGSVAYPLINFLFTETWIYSATLLQIMVFSAMWYPIHAINLNLLIVKGRSDFFLKLEIIKKIIGVIMLCITLPLGLEAMCYGGIVTSLLCLIINTHYTGKILNLGFIKQMRDLLPTLILALVMFTVVKAATYAIGNGILSLITGVVLGAIIYLGGALLFRFPELTELKNLRK